MNITGLAEEAFDRKAYCFKGETFTVRSPVYVSGKFRLTVTMGTTETTGIIYPDYYEGLYVARVAGLEVCKLNDLKQLLDVLCEHLIETSSRPSEKDMRTGLGQFYDELEG